MNDRNGLLVVIPVIATDPTDACIASILSENSSSGIGPEDILLIDNSREGFCAERYPQFRVYRDPDNHNIGVPRSWNIGVREVLERGLDYVVLMSASMLFGPILHCTFRSQLDTFWGADVVEADGHSWHCVAIHARLFELVGLFDENYYPGWHEQVDWCTRLRLIGREGAWPRVWFNAISQGVALSAQHVACPAAPLLAYYEDKWQGCKGEERNKLPWGDKPMGYFPDATIPELAERYGYGPRGGGWW